MKNKFTFTVPRERQIRMIVHADCKNEADDQFALVHHLLTQKFDVRGIIAGHFNINPQEFGVGNTCKASYDEILKVLELMDLENKYSVYMGSEYPLKNEVSPQISEGAQFIINEAMRDDDRPLFIAMQGAITDLASAILINPEICSRMTAVWIGGGAYPKGGPEFNLMNDIAAANVVMGSSMELWQIPKNVYKEVAVSLAELQLHVKPYGRIGDYLYKQLISFNDRRANNPNTSWPNGESWTLGDNPTIGVFLDEVERTDMYEMLPASRFSYEDMSYEKLPESRKIRVYKSVNARLIIGDLFAKLAINYPNQES